MFYKSYYNSPLGKMIILANETAVIGVCFETQKHCNFLQEAITDDNNQIILATKNWLDKYFLKQQPQISTLALAPCGNEFRKCVWQILINIPYGQTTTYGDIAKQVCKKLGKTKMSAQAVGNAVGHNPIAIVIPCHRVVGKNGKLIGYAGGMDKKQFLLAHENAENIFE